MKGPVPMALREVKASFWLVKSCVSTALFFSHHALFIMKRLLASISSITGLGTGVTSCTVYGSIFVGSPTALPYTRKLEVLPCSRLIEKTTSSAVKSLPSCHFTPLRRWNTHVFGSFCSHFSARPGRISSFLPRITSDSYTCPLIEL